MLWHELVGILSTKFVLYRHPAHDHITVIFLSAPMSEIPPQTPTRKTSVNPEKPEQTMASTPVAAVMPMLGRSTSATFVPLHPL